MGDNSDEPVLYLVANEAAVEMLRAFVAQHLDDGMADHVAVLETVIPLRITAGDAARYLYGNGDLVQIYLVEGDGVAFPDPEPRISPLDDRGSIDKD